MNFWMDTAMVELKKAIKKTDLLIINDEEAEQLTGEKNIVKSAKKILKMGPRYSIIKKGDKGSVLISNSKKYDLLSYPVLKVIDPTGAGDSFAGGVAGCLASEDKINFESIKKGMIHGTITASFCIESFGVEGLKKLDKTKLDKRVEIFKSYLMKVS
jgi:sugar/nucleoside kinase (ribokinase family)